MKSIVPLQSTTASPTKNSISSSTTTSSIAWVKTTGSGEVDTGGDNELKFDSWEELPNGGRRYWFEVAGRRGWKARYVKEVDADEKTHDSRQEIYDDSG